MRTILCYGDSNTWGFRPTDCNRHPWSTRWPGAMQLQLGSEYHVVEEGLCGRTTAWDDPLDQGLNGLTYLPISLLTHNPLDLLIIMLGTNDTKIRFNLTPYSIAQGAAELVQLAQRFEPKIPHILLVSPAHIVPTASVENSLAFEGAIEKSKDLGKHYSYFARKLGCDYFDASSVIESSPLDGIHLDAQAHQKLGTCMHAEVMKIFGKPKVTNALPAKN